MLYALLLPFFRDSEGKPFSAEISEYEEISVRNNLDIGAINFGCGSEPKGGSSLRNLGSIEARSLGWRYAFHVGRIIDFAACRVALSALAPLLAVAAFSSASSRISSSRFAPSGIGPRPSDIRL
jgi:hypothetical protein